MSFAEARFGSDGWLLRLSGCLPPFRKRQLGGGLHRQGYSWWYTSWTTALIFVVVVLESAAFYGRWQNRAAHLTRFNRDLFLALRVLFVAKVASQLATVLVKSQETWALLARAAEYESAHRELGVRKLGAFKTARRAIHLLIVTAFFTTRWYVFLRGMHQRLPVFASVVLSTTMVAAGAAVTVWDSAPMILAKCFAEVLVQYLRAENEVLDAMAHGRVVVVTGGNRRYEMQSVLAECRTNVESVLGMLAAAQRLLGTPLLLSFGANMCVVCTVLYSLTDSSSTASMLASATSYACLSFIDGLDVAFASESLADEVAKMKWTLQSLTLCDNPVQFARDVRFFHNVLDPPDMYLTARGFFRINLGQMISMGAAIITYTVILIQSSQDVKN